MILPTKHLPVENSLLAIGARVLQLLDEPKTVSRLWNEITDMRRRANSTLITYDWFVLSLDLLYMLNSIELELGRLRRTN